MRLALGTVQFGMSYGVTNSRGQVPSEEVKEILDYAKCNGVSILDTAPGYGDSERVLGECEARQFKIVSKVSSVTVVENSIDLKSGVKQSLLRLGVSKLHGLLLHNELDSIGENSKRVFEEMYQLKEMGVVEKIGVSFYNPDVLAQALDLHDFDIMQIPVNCLDQRFTNSGLLQEAKQKGIEIHARSLFLQGLLANDSEIIPNSLSPFRADLDRYYDYANMHNLEPLELALAFLVKTIQLDFGVVGCVNCYQLQEIIAAYKKVQKCDLNLDFNMLSSVEDRLLNPSLWR